MDGLSLLAAAREVPDAPALIITDGACDVLKIRREHAFLLPQAQTARLCGMRWLPPWVLHGAHRASEAVEMLVNSTLQAQHHRPQTLRVPRPDVGFVAVLPGQDPGGGEHPPRHDPQLLAPPDERGLVELPLFAWRPGERWTLDGPEGGRFAGRLLTTTLGWASSLLFGRVPQSRQIVLAGGVYGSPLVLLRSGIGDPEELRRAIVAFAEPAVGDLVRVRIDAGFVRVVLADHDVAAGLVGVVDQAVPDLLPGREADIVAGLHRDETAAHRGVVGAADLARLELATQ